MRPSDGEVLHFSEDPAITEFSPAGEYVWAVGYERAPDYWFPRDCPRGLAWATPSTKDTSLLGPGVTRVHVIEYSWLEAMQTTDLYAYRLPATTFRSIGHAMVSTVPVTPLGPPVHVGNLLALHAEAGIELRLTGNIWPWWHEVIKSTLGFSGIRLRNAHSGPIREGTTGMEKSVHVHNGFVWAEDTETDLPPLVFVHPGIADARIWDSVWSTLAGEHRLVRYDARGFGCSAPPTASFSLAEDLVRVLDELSIDQATLVGCSMGGGAALEVALLHPDRVKALVLLAPGIPGYPWPESKDDDDDDTEDVEALVEMDLRVWGRGGADEFTRDLLRSAIKGQLSWSDYIQRKTNVWERLEELSVPSVLLIGDLDKPDLIQSNLEAVNRIAGCRLIELAGVDHFVPYRAPEAVVEAIRSLR